MQNSKTRKILRIPFLARRQAILSAPYPRESFLRQQEFHDTPCYIHIKISPHKVEGVQRQHRLASMK